MKNLKELSREQLENQLKAINAARFLMENDYNGSKTTVQELKDTFRKIGLELASRIQK